MSTVKSTIKDVKAFIELIKVRLTETDNPDSENTKLERSAILSAIDCRLKYLNSMKKDDVHRFNLERIMEVCAEHGFIPQYEISGKPPIAIGKPVISPDSSMTACFFDGTDRVYQHVPLWLTNDMDLAVMSIPTTGHVKNVQFSPDASKIAIIQEGENKSRTLSVWDVLEIKILYSGDFPQQHIRGTWSEEGNSYAFFNEESIAIIQMGSVVSFLLIENPSNNEENICLDGTGSRVATVGCDGIAIFSLGGEVISDYEYPISYPENSVMRYDGDVLYVLADGKIVKIDKEIEIIEIDDTVIPEPCLNNRRLDSAKLSFDGSLKIRFDSSEVCSLSNPAVLAVDVEENRITVLSEDPNRSDKLMSEIVTRIQSIKENSSFLLGTPALAILFDRPDIPLPQKKGDRIYTSKNEQCIFGYELASIGENYVKYNYREYNIINGSLPKEYKNGAIVSVETMSNFPDIVECTNGGYCHDSYDGLERYYKDPNVKIYVQQSG